MLFDPPLFADVGRSLVQTFLLDAEKIKPAVVSVGVLSDTAGIDSWARISENLGGGYVQVPKDPISLWGTPITPCTLCSSSSGVAVTEEKFSEGNVKCRIEV